MDEQGSNLHAPYQRLYLYPIISLTHGAPERGSIAFVSRRVLARAVYLLTDGLRRCIDGRHRLSERSVVPCHLRQYSLFTRDTTS